MENHRFLKGNRNVTGTLTAGRYRTVVLSLVFFGLLGYGIYTTFMLQHLQKDQTEECCNASARIQEYRAVITPVVAQLASEALFDKMGNFAKSIVIGELVEGLKVPIIFTDNYGDPMIWFNIEHGPWYNRQEIEYDDTSYHAKRILKEKVKEFEKKYDPRLVYYNDMRTKIGWLYYDTCR